MKTRLLTLFCLIAILVLLSPGETSLTAAQNTHPENRPPQGLTRTARQFVATLKERGFEVSQGYMRLYTSEDCPYSFAEMHTCYGNNPAAPYVLFAIPPWEEEYLDPATDEAWGPKVAGYSTSYRLDPHEAIVILGVLPPPAAYFGLQTYLFTRQRDFDTKSLPYQFLSVKYPDVLDVFFAKVPQNQERVIGFSSLSNSINNVVIERQSGAAFDQQRIFIITPDPAMDRAVRQALGKILVDAKDIFTEPIPGNMQTGLTGPADEFITVIRYAMPADGGGDGSASDAWRKNLPLVVLRIRDTRPGRSAEVYPPVELENRTANDERPLKPDLLDLVRAVGEKWGQPCIDSDCSNLASGFIRLQLPPINMIGPKCSEIGMNCLGDTEDTAYQYTTTVILDENVVYAVAGTLGTQTGNASYVGLGLMKTMKQEGFANLSNEDLVGTADGYAAQVNHTDQFYLYYFARDCSDLVDLTGGACLEISETDLPPCNDPTSKTCDNLKFSVRDYIRPDTQRGPAPLFKLPSMVITLHKP